MSALDRGIALGKALEALLEHRAPSAEPEPLYPLSELVWRLREQGWKVVRDDSPMWTPEFTEAPYVLATFETLCGCSKRMFMRWPPTPEFRVPHAPDARVLYASTGIEPPSYSSRRFRLAQQWSDKEVLYREVAE